MKNVISLVVIVTTALLISMLASCSTERPLDLVEDAINELERQPGRWRDVLGGTIADLGEMGSSLAADVRAEIETLYNRSLGQTESAGFCSEEFIGTRIRQRLQEILHGFDSSRPSPEIVPVVCITEPIEVKLGETQIVHFYGFDFLEFLKDNNFTASIQYHDNGQVIAQPNVDVTDNYKLSVNLQSVAIDDLDRFRGPQLVLQWANDDVRIEGRQSELAILVPTPLPPPTPIPTRNIIIQGNARIKDDDWPDSDDYGDLLIDPQIVTLSPLTSHSLQFEKCVGGEVRLEILLTVFLKEDLTAETEIKAWLYEGTDCNTDDREDKVPDGVLVYARPDGTPVHWEYTLRNSETTAGDWAVINLSFTNIAP